MVRELLRHLLRKPATLKYPFEKIQLPKGFRGKPVWDLSLCTGCGLCDKDCPAWAIEMIGIGRAAEFKHYISRCLFCGQCAEVCPQNAISMTEEYELASYDQDGMVIEFRRATKD